MAVNRRVAVPLVVVVGLLSLTTALEAARRAGAGPTGAATGGGSAGCGEAVVTVAPIDPVLGPRVGGPTGQAGPADAEADVIPGRFVVAFAPDRGPADPEAWAAALGMGLAVDRHLARTRRGGASDPHAGVWTVRGDAALPAALAGQPEVLWVEPLLRTRAAAIPDDPYYGYQWNLSTLGVPDAWETTRGRGVVVAVLDTGVSPGPDGLSLLLDGYDFVDDDPDPSDSGWHGTHVSGVIAQVTDNGEGVASVAPGMAILPVRVLGEDGGNTADLAAGIAWAVDQGADVLNLSLGTSGESQAVSDALAAAEAAGVVVVAASGNDGYSDFVQFPASVDTVLAVGAALLDTSTAPYSNQGAGLDLVAPAGTLDQDTDGDGLPDGILQEAWIDHDWRYVVAEGTSVATPHVAAVAGLIASVTELGPADIREALRASAVDLGAPGWDPASGHGLLDPVAALLAAGASPDAAEADDDADDDGLGGVSGGAVRPTTGDTVPLGPEEGGTLGCGG